MAAISAYVLRLCCGAMICAMLQTVCGSNGAGARMRKTISALFLAFLALSPFKDFDIRDYAIAEFTFDEQGTLLAGEGAAQAQEVFSELISERYASYILSRAAELSLSPEVSVELDEASGAPLAVTIRCEATPYEKSRLSEEIHQNLGIERSRILWNP